jgi:CDP-diacylglycerol--serine O-phosphatidyltransferase
MAYWVKMGWFFQSKVGNHDVPFGIRKLWDSKHGYGEIHLASLIFAVWGAMMVSKTLKVSLHLPFLASRANRQVPKL